ncbi:MAG: non-ribosomal peptide synthetase [Deltaproteobacteria bacterium]|nr:non-ribosomal peptide synthetase [Deltaproteobacteria bacterium]
MKRANSLLERGREAQAGIEMSDSLKQGFSLPPEQQAIRDQCFHPSGKFVEFPKEDVETSIPARFEKIVRMYPERVAVRSAHQELTYAEINQRANQIAHALLAYSDKQEEPIAMLLETDAATIATMLGILKAGKIYVLMDASLPHARIAYILEDSQARLLITNSKNFRLAQELALSKIPIINLDEIDWKHPAANPTTSISPATLTWILYTSGSTGKPKGVVQNHRNVLHFVMNYTNGLHLCAADRMTLLFSASANGASHDIFSALLNGAALYPFNIKKEGPARMHDWLVQNQLTVFCSVPTVFRYFLQTLTGAERFPQLRLIKLIGEPVSRSDLESYRSYFSSVCIFLNRLGSTETGTIRWHFFDKTSHIDGHIVPVGYPVAGNEILILDDAASEVGMGDVGEISVKSRYLTPGYWRRPDLSRSVLFFAGGDERIYRTGDIGRMLPNGCLLCLGRKDSQVKIRGHRVELAEIEMAFVNLGTIKAAVVVPWEEPSKETKLVAYLLPKSRPAPTVSELRLCIGKTIPEHMIPSKFIILENFPLAPNGKLDRKALPQPGSSRPELDMPYVAPRTPVETALSEVWAGVLSIDQVGVHDNFLDLGGDSLLATQVISRVRQAFQMDLPLLTIFEKPTVEELTIVIMEKSSERGAGEEGARILAELKSHSEDEARRLIAEESGKPSRGEQRD